LYLIACVCWGLGCPPQAAAQIKSEAGEANTVNLDIPELDIAPAMQMLADATGLNILVSPNAKGKITAYVLEMDPEQALEEIARVNGLHYVREGEVVWILSDDEYFEDLNLGRERRVIVLEHAHALDVASVLGGGILSTFGIAIPHAENNVIVVAEDKSRMEEIARIVAELDVPPDTRVFQLQYASALEILPLLQTQLINPNALQVDVRTNQILVTAPEASLQRIGTLIAQFDKPDKVATRVFPLQYADAVQTADLVREVLTGRKQSGDSSFSSGPSTNQEQPSVFTTEPGRRTAVARPQDSWRAMRERTSGAPTAPAPGAEGAPVAPTAPTPSPASSGASPSSDMAAPGGEDVALGPLSSVAADPRTNSVIVTHVQSILDRIEQIILTIDVPGNYLTYQFKNVNPAELGLEQRLAPLLPLENAFLSIDPGTRKVTVRAPADQGAQILALLEEWDGAVPQVRIDADVLRVNLSFLRDIGVSWQAAATEVTRNLPLDATNGIQQVDRVISAGGDSRFAPNFGESENRSEWTIGNLNDDDYAAIIRAVRDDNDSQIIASPNMLVRDGQEASFSSVRDQPYTVVTVDGNTQTTLEDVRFLNVGLSLFVAPVVNPDGLITMDVQLEISNLVDFSGDIPVVDRSTAQSSVSVESGGTVALAGLRQRARTNLTSGVPGLSRVPLLGTLFRSKRKQKDEQEIILLIRPSLVANREEELPFLGEMYDRNTQFHQEDTLGPDGKTLPGDLTELEATDVEGTTPDE
jgi:type II secretory pathway component GspD/PulD (secretin)